MTNFHALDGDSLKFNSSVIAVLVGVRLECGGTGWKNNILLCRGLGILRLVLFIPERGVPSG